MEKKVNNSERLQLEWLVINAIRENLSLINDAGNYSYNDTIRFAKENFGELFQSKDSFFGKKRTVSRDYERYEQKATASSNSTHTKITAEDLIFKDIDELNKLINSPENKETEVNRLKSEIKKLKKLLRENQPQITHETENPALRNDYRIDRPGLKYIDQYAGKMKLYRTKNKQQFTIRFLHPDQPETATGADLIYEIIDTKNDRVRIIAIQYKMWEDGTLYFSQSTNLASQLKTAEKCFCKKGFCDGEKTDGNMYRLPYCTPFLRPTDKIYDTEKLLTSGWHIPICQIKHYSEDGPKDKILRLERIKKAALNTEEFEKLFQQEKIGSRWLLFDELEDFYRETGVLNHKESIVVFSQKFTSDHH